MFFRIYGLMAGALVGCAALAGCDTGTEDQENITSNTAQQSAEALPNTAQPVEMPPMVARSASYRCDDGDALYVAILTDENLVNVRDSRADLPTQLSREGGTGPFTAEGYTLSGVGDVVRYGTPERPEQECRAAPE